MMYDRVQLCKIPEFQHAPCWFAPGLPYLYFNHELYYLLNSEGRLLPCALTAIAKVTSLYVNSTTSAK